MLAVVAAVAAMKHWVKLLVSSSNELYPLCVCVCVYVMVGWENE